MLNYVDCDGSESKLVDCQYRLETRYCTQVAIHCGKCVVIYVANGHDILLFFIQISVAMYYW